MREHRLAAQALLDKGYLSRNAKDGVTTTGMHLPRVPRLRESVKAHLPTVQPVIKVTLNVSFVPIHPTGELGFGDRRCADAKMNGVRMDVNASHVGFPTSVDKRGKNLNKPTQLTEAT
jgi:hypothetical protein